MTDEIKTLAELMYMERIPKRPWSELQQVYKDKWYETAKNAINCLSKMNKVVANKSQLKNPDEERKIFNALVITIKDFVKGLRTTKPELFPCEELAHKLLKD